MYIPVIFLAHLVASVVMHHTRQNTLYGVSEKAAAAGKKIVRLGVNAMQWHYDFWWALRFQIPLMRSESEKKHLAIITCIRFVMRVPHQFSYKYEIAVENVASLELCDSFDIVFTW